MRADRLLSLVLLLRQRGKLTATELARALEVSARTILRDIEALSAAGVPVYSEQGRHGGFGLVAGYRIDLSGLRRDEALALVLSSTNRDLNALGLGSHLSSAALKVVDALPAPHQPAVNAAVERVLLDPQHDLLERSLVGEL